MANNHIHVFCPDGTESAGDLLSTEAYRTDSHRLRGHQPGIARRELENKALRQATWMASALAQLIVNKTNRDVVDAGSIADLAATLGTAVVGKDYGADIAALWAAINGLGSGGSGGSGGDPGGGAYMPLAKAGAGVGQLVAIALPGGSGSVSAALPAGGSWAYSYVWVGGWGEGASGSQQTGIAAGGTTLYNGVPVFFWGWAWRIV